jgi:hypothetical protein
MSEPVIASTTDAVLFARLGSLVAPVDPFKVDEPVAVGVPVTEHEIDAPAATVVGGAGKQVAVSPGGNPASAHDAVVAATAGELAFEHV